MPSTAPINSPFDFKIGTLGFRLVPSSMLGRARGGRIRQPHAIAPVPFFAPQQSSSQSELGYSSVSRATEIPLAQADFRGGVARQLIHEARTANQFRWSKNLDTSSPSNEVLPGPLLHALGGIVAAKPVAAVQKGAVYYMAAGAVLYQLTTLAGAWVVDTTFAQPITSLFVWQGTLLVGFGTTQTFRYRTSQTAGAAFTDATVYAYFFATTAGFQGTLGEILWRSTDYQVAAANQLSPTALWAAYDVGPTDYSIQSITSLNNSLYVAKQDGPWVLEGNGNALRLAPELAITPYQVVGRAAIAWRGDYYVCGKFNIYRVRKGTIESIGFDTLADPQAPGIVPTYAPSSFATDGRFLYAIICQDYAPLVDQSNGVYIWKLDANDAWHNYLYRTDLGLSAAMLTTTGRVGADDVNAVIFAAKSGASWQLYWSRFPSVADPTKDSAYEFDTVYQGSLRTLDYTVGLPTIRKFVGRAKVVADEISQTTFVDLYGYVDKEAVRKLARFERPPFQTKRLHRPAYFNRMSAEIRMTGGATLDLTKVPKVHGLHFAARVLPDVVRQHTVTLMAGSQQALASGGRAQPRDSRPGNWKRSVNALRELVRTNAEVEIQDEDGRSFTAYLDQIHEFTFEAQEAQDFEPTKGVAVVLTEVDPAG